MGSVLAAWQRRRGLVLGEHPLLHQDPRSPLKLEYPPKKQGLNKWTWDLRRDGIACIEDVDLFAGFDGPRVPPGEYRARVSVGGASAEAPFSLVPDWRVTASPAEVSAWSARLEETAALLDEVLRVLDAVRAARIDVEGLMADHPGDAELQQAGARAIEALTAWDRLINQHLHQTAEDEDAWDAELARRAEEIRSGQAQGEPAEQVLAELRKKYS